MSNPYLAEGNPYLSRCPHGFVYEQCDECCMEEFAKNYVEECVITSDEEKK